MRDENRRLVPGRIRLDELEELEGFVGGAQAEGDLGEVGRGWGRTGEEEATELGGVP